MLAALVAATVVAVRSVEQARPAEAAPVAGFADNAVITGLTLPTNVAFAPDGKVFVAEKSGLVKMFSSLSSTTPTVFADLRTQVYNWWDHGLLSLAVDPDWPASPYIYVAYSFDALPSAPGTSPRYGSAGVDSDPCAFGGYSTTGGCPALGRVSRLIANTDLTAMASETVLVTGFCTEYSSHSMGDLRFAPDGSLIVSAGEGANYITVDTGKLATPPNPCGDPNDSGGALRAQQLRSGQLTKPVSLDGSILRIDKMTGAAVGDNPLAGRTDTNARRVVANGLRNPFRFTLRPGTDEVWIGDVGWGTTEEINRLPSANPASVVNFGWPCYEGGDVQNSYSSNGLCQSLYATPAAATGPWFSYRHGTAIRSSEPCGTNDSSPTGLAFYTSGSYPSRYNGALFFADYARRCIWAFLRGSDGLPDPSTVQLFVGNAASPVDLEIGPNGDLFYVNINEGEVRRVVSTGGNEAPTAAVSADTHAGGAPLTVRFDAGGSTDPNSGDALSYAWDFEGNGAFTDSTSVAPTHTYAAEGVYVARVRVTDPSGANSIATTIINVGGGSLSPPQSGGWKANGSASTAACSQLTGTATGQTGSIVRTSPVGAAVLTVSFDATLGSGTAGEGLTFALLDAAAGSNALGAGGGELGFGGLPGFAVALDTVKESTEPSSNFVGIAKSIAGGPLTYLSTSTDVSTLRGRTVHVDVVAAARRLRVIVDGREVLNQSVTLPGSVLPAFTATTGSSSSDRHQVCNVQISTAANAAGRLVATPATMDFGSVPAGGEAVANVTLSNTGIGPVTVASVSLPAAPFSVETPIVSGSVIDAGTTVTGKVRFRPDATGAESSTYAVQAGASGNVSFQLTGSGASSTYPRASISAPSSSTHFVPGQSIAFAGAGTTSTGAALPASALTWTIVIQHCSTASSCHAHTLQSFSGTAGGSFVAPDHGYPSFLDVQLTVTSGGQSSTRSIRIDPVTTTMTFDTTPSGLELTVGAEASPRTTPFTMPVMVGSELYVSAASTQVTSAGAFSFSSWSNGGAVTQNVTVPATPTTLVARYATVRCGRSGLEVPISTNGSGPAAPPNGATGYQPITPTRLFDTRIGLSEVCAGETLVADVLGRAGVPSSGVGAIALNLTVTQAQAPGYITVWPANQARPNASALNFGPGDTTANMVIVPVGATGDISLRNADDSAAMGPVQLIADVVGYFPTGSGFTGINPTRLLDTRSGNGAPTGALAPGSSIDVALTGRGALPTVGVDAVVLNLTATDSSSDGYLTTWPSGDPKPNASSLNFSAGRTTPNLVLAKVSGKGRVSIWNSNDSPSMGAAHVVADVTGWFPFGSGFTSQSPQRVLDTRSGIGSAKSPLRAGDQLDLQVTGRGGVPPSGVSAVVLNVTATNMSTGGYITTWPTGQARPGASSLNYTNRNVANLVIARVSADGRVSLWNANDSSAMRSVDLVADVVGWFTS